jgi:hypothetical protein
MRQNKSLFCIIMVTALAAGCATRSSVVVNQPVGPDLAPPKVNSSQGNGQLVVYSAVEVANPVNTDFPTHAGYEIDDAGGKLFRRVDNRSGSFYQSPAPVSLPPGKYLVKAPATNYGLVTVPVVIKENETTTLDLEATHFRQHKPTGAGQWVRLPTGEVIGMRSP